MPLTTNTEVHLECDWCGYDEWDTMYELATGDSMSYGYDIPDDWYGDVDNLMCKSCYKERGHELEEYV